MKDEAEGGIWKNGILEHMELFFFLREKHKEIHTSEKGILVERTPKSGCKDFLLS